MYSLIFTLLLFQILKTFVKTLKIGIKECKLSFKILL